MKVAEVDYKEPQRGFPRLVFKLRTGGLDWVRKRIAFEATLPTTRIGQAIHLLTRKSVGAASAIPRGIRRLRWAQSAKSVPTRDILYAFYDLKVAPITFDFLWFLTGADLHRRRLGLASVHVVIVPGPHNGLRRERDDYEAAVDATARQARIHNILSQACRVLPSCAGLTLASSRAEAAFLRGVARAVFPPGYEPALPIYPGAQFCLDAAKNGEAGIACLRAPADELRVIDRWAAAQAGQRLIVTITLRRYGYMAARNSDVSAWAAFARSLDATRYLPVVVPDHNDTAVGLPPEMREFAALPEAAWSVPLRMALYERAFLNLGVNNGPMGLCWLNERTRYATLRMETADVPQTTADYFRDLGFELGRSLPFATSVQEWCWEDDTEEAIQRAFARLAQKIEMAAAA
jgi:hypothetical protein